MSTLDIKQIRQKPGLSCHGTIDDLMVVKETFKPSVCRLDGDPVEMSPRLRRVDPNAPSSLVSRLRDDQALLQVRTYPRQQLPLSSTLGRLAIFKFPSPLPTKILIFLFEALGACT